MAQSDGSHVPSEPRDTGGFSPDSDGACPSPLPPPDTAQHGQSRDVNSYWVCTISQNLCVGVREQLWVEADGGARGKFNMLSDEQQGDQVVHHQSGTLTLGWGGGSLLVLELSDSSSGPFTVCVPVE